MTELMKQFQDETGIDLFGGWSYQVVNGMMTPPLSESPWMKFNQWLCNKFTWRPVSASLNNVSPQEVFLARTFEGNLELVTSVQLLKPCSGYVSYLPIPPAPEGGIV
jgi:hypothetical protein